MGKERIGSRSKPQRKLLGSHPLNSMDTSLLNEEIKYANSKQNLVERIIDSHLRDVSGL